MRDVIPKTPPATRQIDNWRDAEMNAAEWMRYWGYTDAKAAPGGSDGGVDVWSRQALAQVKFQGAPVGRPVLQRLVGARMNSDQQLLFFTGSSYAQPALEYANAMSIALFIYDPWGRMRPVNGAAERIMQGCASEHLGDAAAELMSWLNEMKLSSPATARQLAETGSWTDRVARLVEKGAIAADRAVKARRGKASLSWVSASAKRSPRSAEPDYEYDGSEPLKHGRDDLGAGLVLGAIPLLWLLNLDPIGWVEALATGFCWLGLGYGIHQWRAVPSQQGGVGHGPSIAKRSDWLRQHESPATAD